MTPETTAGLVRLLRHDQLPEGLRDLGERYLLGLARAGRLGPIRPIRVTARSPALFPEDQVLAFIEAKVREAQAAAS